MKAFKEYLITFILFVIVTIITFYEVYNGSKVFVSGDTLSPIAIRDGIQNFVKIHGYYPYWLPWIFSGMPSVHSFTNISDFYFPHQLFLLLNKLGIPWVWNFLLHIIFGGVGMYALLKYLNCSKYSSILSSICFMTLPYITAMTAFGHGSQVMSASYIPLIILFLFKIYDRINLFDLSIFTILIGFQLQRGHVQICYYTWMMIGLFILVKNIFLISKNTIHIAKLVKKNIYIVCSLLTGLLISSNLYLPVFSYLNNSIRSEGGSGGGLSYATQWSYSFKEIISFFIPSFLGFGGQLYWGNLPFTDYPNYFGFILFILAIIGFLKSDFLKEIKVFFLLVFVFSFFISLGSNFLEFYKLFYYYFPFFNKFRVPVYILILTFFSLLVFSAKGLDYIKNEIADKVKLRKLIITFSLVSIFCVILLFTYKSLLPVFNQQKLSLIENLIFNDLINIISILLILIVYFLFVYFKNLSSQYIYVLIIFLCLYDFTRINHEIIKPELHIPNSEILKNQGYIDNYKYRDDLVKYLSLDESKYRIFDTIGPQNKWASFNIENVQGYHPAKLKNYDNFMYGLRSQGYQIWPPNILKLLNVKYLILPFDNFEHPNFDLIKSAPQYYFGPDKRFDGKLIESSLYKFTDYYPRLFFTKKIINVNQKDIYNLIFKSDFDPIEISYLDEDDKIDIIFDESSKVEILNWKPDRIEFSTDVSSTQFLILSEIFYDDSWFLTDGEVDYKIYNVNGILRGAIIPPGKKNFVMYFKSNEIIIGKFLSIVFFIVVFFIIIFSVLRRRSDKII